MTTLLTDNAVQFDDINTLPFINNFQILPFKKTAHFWFPGQNCGN